MYQFVSIIYPLLNVISYVDLMPMPRLTDLCYSCIPLHIINLPKSLNKSLNSEKFDNADSVVSLPTKNDASQISPK